MAINPWLNLDENDPESWAPYRPRPVPTGESETSYTYTQAEETDQEYMERLRGQWPTDQQPTQPEPITYPPAAAWADPGGGGTDLSAYAPYPSDESTTGPTMGAGGGGYSYSLPTAPAGPPPPQIGRIGGVSTTTTTYPGQFPTDPVAGTFTAPEWDEREVSRLAQMRAGPGLRMLRREAQRASGQYYENPNVKRMTMREAFAGMGMGIGPVLAGATTGAAQEYGARYQSEYGAALTSYQAQQNAMMAAYQAAMQEYMAERETVTTTEDIYGEVT